MFRLRRPIRRLPRNRRLLPRLLRPATATKGTTAGMAAIAPVWLRARRADRSRQRQETRTLRVLPARTRKMAMAASSRPPPHPALHPRTQMRMASRRPRLRKRRTRTRPRLQRRIRIQAQRTPALRQTALHRRIMRCRRATPATRPLTPAIMRAQQRPRRLLQPPMRKTPTRPHPVHPDREKPKDSGNDQTNANAADTPSAASQSSNAANAATPVATVIVANSAIDSTPGSVAAATSNIAIGAQAKARTQAAASPAGGQDAPATQDNTGGTADTDAASAKAVAANNAANATSAETDQAAVQAPATPSTGAQTPASFQQALTQEDNAATQADANAQANSTIATAHGDGAGGTASADGTASTGQAAASGAKRAAGDVPTLGIAAANVATTPPTTSAASTTTTAPSVSIAGLPVAIASRAQAGSSQFDIRLDPPDLGRIEVRLDVDSNGRVTSHITADRQDTLTLLQNQQPQLERALEQAGLKTSDNSMQFSLRDQSFSGQQNQNSGQNGSGAQSSTQQLVIPDSSLSAVDTTQIYSRLNLRGGLDIRV